MSNIQRSIAELVVSFIKNPQTSGTSCSRVLVSLAKTYCYKLAARRKSNTGNWI